MPKLRKTLQKDIGTHMESAAKSGDYSNVQALLAKCDPDARTDRFSKTTALMFSECTPELARWLLDNGLDVNATDTWGRTALYHAAGASYYSLSVSSLIELGANFLADKDLDTPLHTAVDNQNLDAISTLLEHGADINALNESGQTPLGYALARIRNIDLERMVPVAKALLDAGANVSSNEQKAMFSAAEDFEFHRSGYNPDMVDATADAVQSLCTLFNVTPPAQRKMHDGQSSIILPAGTNAEIYAELWDFLVPSSGACETMQGEVIRIPGRIRDELYRNGGMNWDQDFKMMATALCEYLASGNALDAAALAEAVSVTNGIRQKDDQIDRLIELCLLWVGQNPKPIRLAQTSYSR